jgi:hypothetical protein
MEILILSQGTSKIRKYSGATLGLGEAKGKGKVRPVHVMKPQRANGDGSTHSLILARWK